MFTVCNCIGRYFRFIIVVDFIVTQAKLAARKARREQEVNRRAKEDAQQRILEEQSQLVVASQPKDTSDIVIPDVIVSQDTIEVTVSASIILVASVVYLFAPGAQLCPGIKWFVRRRCLSNLASLSS